MTLPVVLSIAGSDPSGGAGIQADLKTFSALECYGCAAIAGLTVQNTQGVRSALPVPAQFVADQVAAVFDDLPVAATKIGMLTNAETASAVTELIASRRADFGLIVLDPVMVATSGDSLLSPDAVAVIRDQLMPQADVITPNLPEAGVLLEEPTATTGQSLGEQALALVAAGARAALVKGGHLAGDELIDVFATASGAHHLTAPRIQTRNTHGTGCTLSSALAATAARRGETSLSLESVQEARSYLFAALASAANWQLSRTPETGHGPVNHLVKA